MQAIHLGAGASGATHLTALQLPVLHRAGPVDAEPYRRQARGDDPLPDQKLHPATGVRGIRLGDGVVDCLFDLPGQQLNFIISGALLVGGECRLVAGDVLLGSAATGAKADIHASGNCHLVQLGVGDDWPGPAARTQSPGTILPREGARPKLLRMFEGADHRSYFSSFAGLFPPEADVWSEIRPVRGFRFLCFADPGFIDFHPEVVNNLAIFLSGEVELECGGAGGAIEIFRAGDICLAEDRTGEGHIDRTRGETYMALIVLETAHLWPAHH